MYELTMTFATNCSSIKIMFMWPMFVKFYSNNFKCVKVCYQLIFPNSVLPHAPNVISFVNKWFLSYAWLFLKLIRTGKYLLWLMSILYNMFLSNQLTGFFANPPLCWLSQRVDEPRQVWLTNIIHKNVPIIKRLLLFALSRVNYEHIMSFANPVVSPLRACRSRSQR